MESSQAKEFKILKEVLKELAGVERLRSKGLLEGFEENVNELLEDTMYQAISDIEEGLSEIIARGEEE